MYRTAVTICTTSLTFNNSTFCPHSVFVCFVWISEQTAIIYLHSFNWLVFITTDWVYTHTHTGVCADKSLARPISQCRRTESIVSLERGVCSCAELQVFSCYRGWEEACQATRAISTTSRRELSSSFFFLQGKAQKEIHAILTETLGNMLHHMPPP